MTRPLRFGLWYAFRNPPQWKQPYPELYRATLDQISWAETIGYDDVWLTEHHFCEDGHAPSILPIAAAVAARTERIRIGTGVLLLPLHHPVRVAEDGATIDILSGGRFELGVGVGYRVQEFDGLGIPRSERAGRVDEGLEIIRRLWEGERLDYEGKYFRIRGAVIEPRPVQEPRPPLWVGGFAEAAVRRAARLADGYIGTGDMAELARGYRSAHAAIARSGGSSPGSTGAPRLAGGHFWLVVAKEPEKTFSDLAPHILYQIDHYNRWLSEAGQTLFPEVRHEASLRDSGILQVLTPAQATDAIGAYAEATGIERYYTWTVPPGYPTERMNEHLQLFAEEVMPNFR